MEILSQHTVDIQQHCAVFDKAPVAFAMFRLIFGKTGEYRDYQMVYHNHALEKIFENIGIEDIIAELDKKDQGFLSLLCEVAKQKQQKKTYILKREKERYYEIIVYPDRKDHVACILNDVTERSMEERRHSEEFQDEVHQRVKNGTDLLWEYCRYNLTTDTIEYLEEKGKKITDKTLLEVRSYYDRMKRLFEEIGISQNDANHFSRKYLLEQYQSGVSDSQFNFFARDYTTKAPLYLKLECKLLRHPGNLDVVAFFYTRDESRSYMEKCASEAILGNDYDFAGIIYTKADNYFYCKQNKGKYQEEYISGNYPELIRQSLLKFCVNDDVEKRVWNNSMEEIQKRLRLKTVYRTEVDMLNPNDGTIHRKNLSYRYVDSKKNIIAVNQVDVESVVRREREKKQQLETALNLAEQANNAKSEFLATVSHEIRTPMNVVLGLTDLAKSEIENREVLLDYLNKIEVSGKHLLHLVNDVLDMSKIESGEFKLHPVRCNLKDFLINMQNYVQTLCKQKNITLLIAAGKDFPDIYVDKLRLDQIFINIISNAVKFTPYGGKILLSMQTNRQDHKINCRFEVADNGIGMSEEFQKNLFKPFMQEERMAQRPVEGTGLGLAIAYGIINKMNGNIEIKSEKNIGTTFLINLSFEEADKDSTPKKQFETEKVLLEGKNVLIIEDHPINQMILSKMLKNQGAQIYCADNGKIGLEMFEQSDAGMYDIIFMDIRMPVMDGLEAARNIRKLDRPDAKCVPIIAMTANAYDEDREKSEKAGINVHLSKPIDSQILRKTIAEILQKKTDKIC
ncbi:putative uncharacterized protein [Clostridium sp. CAG:230]|nr:putative uncharacterized protein [Clostridium sp. CAG:230]